MSVQGGTDSNRKHGACTPVARGFALLAFSALPSQGARMTAASATRLALWFICAVVALVLPASGQAQNRPITIPPATQITPPALPPAAPAATQPTVHGIPPARHPVLPSSSQTV